MADPEEPTKDEEIAALRKDNARLSRLLAISRHQVDHMKEQCAELRKVIADALSKNKT